MSNTFLDTETIEYIKQMYIPGTRIRMIKMVDDPRPIAPGDTGTVTCVDDIGTIDISWDSGRNLGVVPGTDLFVVINDGLESDYGK